MAYATEAQIAIAAGGSARLVELADFDRDGAADPAVLAQAIAEVDAQLDSYIAVRFAVPLASPTSALQAVAAAEVVHWLRSKRGMVAEDHQREHLERVEWLTKISRGHVLPSDPVPAKSSVVRSGWVSRDDDEVSRERLKGAW